MGITQGDEQRVERGDTEELRRLVERRLLDQLGIALIETADLRHDHDEREGDHRGGLQAVITEEGEREGQGDGRGQEICGRQKASIHRLAAGDDLQRQVVRQPARLGDADTHGQRNARQTPCPRNPHW